MRASTMDRDAGRVACTCPTRSSVSLNPTGHQHAKWTAANIFRIGGAQENWILVIDRTGFGGLDQQGVRNGLGRQECPSSPDAPKRLDPNHLRPRSLRTQESNIKPSPDLLKLQHLPPPTLKLRSPWARRRQKVHHPG